ncbi:hypothetical protein CXF88_02120 [Shewanella sp. ALD9]|nr:hypothetical protein CXF88_02120 [Shewanella sp. ALD9]
MALAYNESTYRICALQYCSYRRHLVKGGVFLSVLKAEHYLRSAHQHISTSAHQHISTSAHQHISTSAHQHISTSAHQHISTSAHPE